jgi:hypothetical protein
MLIANQFIYVAAHDPDSNYTELVTPDFYYPPQLDSIPDQNARLIGRRTFDGVAYTEAMKNSFAKYQGAAAAGDDEWIVKQMSTVRLYSEQASECFRAVASYLDTLMIEPTQSQIDSMISSFASNGLPDLEKSILTQFGISQTEMDEMAAAYASLPSEFYANADQAAGLIESGADYLDSLSYYFPGLVGSPLVARLGVDPDTLILYSRSTTVTCWTEFPDSLQLSNCQILTSVLDDGMSASVIGETPGDHDSDGLQDFSIQFDLTDLLPDADSMMLLTVTGDMRLPSGDTTFYSGSALLIVIHDTYICGDANSSGGDPAVDIDDVVYLINYIFAGGPAPLPIEAGDADCSGGDPSVDIDDVVYLINYIFAGGPEPCAECK